MKYKIIDAQCTHCKKIQEVWLEDDKLLSEQDHCVDCNGYLEKILSVSHKHLSWSTWAINVGS